MPSQNNPIKYIAAGLAAVAIAFGAYTIGTSNSGTASAGTASAAQGAAPAAVQNGQLPGNGQARPGGFGTPVTGTAATKVKDAVLAKYSGATVERMMKLKDGSYVVHVFSNGSELHVAVSKDYNVTGAQQGGPGGGTPPSGGPGAAGTSAQPGATA